jgi:hypothetical protein
VKMEWERGVEGNVNGGDDERVMDESTILT